MTHTPGPWTIDDDRPSIIWAMAPDDDVSCFLDKHAIASAHGPEKVRFANARLIAAVPELLAALQQVEWIENRDGELFCPCCTWPKQDGGHRRTCELKQALARARAD